MATASTMENGATTNKSRLLNLPQELQDHIFDYAYPPPPEGTKLISRKQWDERERKARLNDSSHTARPFPPLKVADFLVSKKFLANAAAAYVGYQQIDAALVWYTSNSHRCKHNILPGNATHILTGSADIPILHWFPKLRKITLKVSDYHFEGESCYFDLLESSRVSDNLLKDTEVFRDCAAFALSDIVVKAVQFNLNELQGQNFEANLRRIEELLKPIIKENWEKKQEAAKKSTEKPDTKEPDLNYSEKSLEDTMLEAFAKMATTEGPSSKTISDEEVPDDPQDILKLMLKDPFGMVFWIQEAKQRLR